MKCRLCSRDATSDLCPYHEEARERVKSTYHQWVNAYGSIEWRDYLKRVVENVQTGDWAREAAEMLQEGM